MKHAVFFLSLLVLLNGCTTNLETRKAQKQVAERREIYSQQAGTLYRYPPTDTPFEKPPEALPAGMVLSYSAITGETTYIPKRAGRSMQAIARKKTSRKKVASYSPLTGEAVWIPSDKR